MPTYEYKCETKPDDKEHRYLEVRPITSEESKGLICKVDGCGAKLLKIFNAPPIKFGNGFGGSIFR